MTPARITEPGPSVARSQGAEEGDLGSGLACSGDVVPIAPIPLRAQREKSDRAI